jgi:hypothetical protein
MLTFTRTKHTVLLFTEFTTEAFVTVASTVLSIPVKVAIDRSGSSCNGIHTKAISQTVIWFTISTRILTFIPSITTFASALPCKAVAIPPTQRLATERGTTS